MHVCCAQEQELVCTDSIYGSSCGSSYWHCTNQSTMPASFDKSIRSPGLRVSRSCSDLSSPLQPLLALPAAAAQIRPLARAQPTRAQHTTHTANMRRLSSTPFLSAFIAGVEGRECSCVHAPLTWVSLGRRPARSALRHTPNRAARRHHGRTHLATAASYTYMPKTSLTAVSVSIRQAQASLGWKRTILPLYVPHLVALGSLLADESRHRRSPRRGSVGCSVLLARGRAPSTWVRRAGFDRCA